MAIKHDNPAARLVALLEHAQRINADSPIKHAWAVLYGGKPDDDLAALAGKAAAIRLISETRQALADDPHLQDALYTEPLDVLSKVMIVQGSWDNPWRSVIGQLDPRVMHVLRINANQLGRTTKTSALTPEELEGLLKQLDDVRQDVLDSDLPIDLKTFIVSHLEEIRASLVQYRIYGNKGVVEQLAKTIGMSWLAYRTELKDAEDVGAKKKFVEFVNLLAGMVTIVQGVSQLGPGIAGWLTGPTP